jgi:hypothetical protein
MAKAQTRTKSVPSAAAAPARRLRVGRARRATTKPSVLRRVGQMVWVSPRHAALALATGLVCGVFSSRIGGMISPPYAAILGDTRCLSRARRGLAAVAATGETQPMTTLLSQERRHTRKGRGDGKPRLDAHDAALRSAARRGEPRRGRVDCNLSAKSSAGGNSGIHPHLSRPITR